MRNLMLKSSLVLAMVAFLAITSCKSGPIFGGPDIPQTQSTRFFKFGSEWQTFRQLPFQNGWLSSVYDDGLAEGETRIMLAHADGPLCQSPSTTELSFPGSHIAYAYRFSPTEMQNPPTMSKDEMGLYVVSAVRDVKIVYTGVVDSATWDWKEEVSHNCYTVDQNSRVEPVDKSDFKAGYTLWEFTDIPASPTGLYVLAITWFGIRDQVIILKSH
jgi:hypothetical protein